MRWSRRLTSVSTVSKASVKSLLQLAKQFFYVVLIEPRCPKDREDERDNGNSGGDDCDIRTHTLESLTEAHTFANSSR